MVIFHSYVKLPEGIYMCIENDLFIYLSTYLTYLI